MVSTAWVIPAGVALAIVSWASYRAGRKAKRTGSPAAEVSGSRELRRAENVIRELETISQEVRRNLASHHASVLRFKDSIHRLSDVQDGAAWQALSDEAERMLKPTLKLSTQIAHAYDEIRQQTNLLMLFTEVRTDALTGLSNRRAMEETLSRLFALKTRYHTTFALAMIDLDHFKAINDRLGHLQGDQVLRQFAGMLAETARETDLAVRYGGEEFLVIMPQTDLLGGCIFCERLRQKTLRDAPVTISVGVAEVLDGDTLHSLLSRADAALYSAKAGGRNCVFRHTGERVEHVGDLWESSSSSWRGAETQSDVHADPLRDPIHSHFPAVPPPRSERNAAAAAVAGESD